MNEHNDPPHHVVIEKVGRPNRIVEPLPPISPSVTKALRELLDAASHATDFWHTIPEFPLALRILPPIGSDAALAFEIRTADQRGTVQRFRYEPGTRTLWASDQDSHVHPEIFVPPDLPKEPHRLGRCLTALVYHHPEIVRRVELRATPTRDPDSSSAGQEQNRPGPVSFAVTDLIRHLTGHWFTGHHAAPGRLARFTIALAGSLTFVVIQAAVLAAQFPEWIRGLVRPTGPLDSDYSMFVPPWVLVPVIPLIAAGFASLTSCLNHQHGPVRIYLGGFLLPYFIATLLMWLYAGGTSP